MGAKNNETSQKILSSAFQCIARNGCNSVTLREIAEHAGVALSQLNYYHKNKEVLFSEVLKSMKQDYVQHVVSNMANRPSIKGKTQFLIEYNKHLLTDNRALYRAFLDFFNLAMWSESFRVEMNDFLDGIINAIERQISDDKSAPADELHHSPAALARMILATTFGIAMQYLMHPEQEDALDGFDILLALVER
jgi:AcrR family transcriptional regulator